MRHPEVFVCRVWKSWRAWTVAVRLDVDTRETSASTMGSSRAARGAGRRETTAGRIWAGPSARQGLVGHVRRNGFGRGPGLRPEDRRPGLDGDGFPPGSKGVDRDRRVEPDDKDLARPGRRIDDGEADPGPAQTGQGPPSAKAR